MSCISCNSGERPSAVPVVSGIGVGSGLPPAPPKPSLSIPNILLIKFLVGPSRCIPNPVIIGLFWINSGRESSPFSPTSFTMGERSPPCIISMILPPNPISTGPPLFLATGTPART